MRVVRRADHHGVDLLVQFVQHPAEVAELLRLGMLLVGLARPLVVHVAQGHHVLIGKPFQVVAPAAADADKREIQLFVGRILGTSGSAGGDPKPRSHGGAGFQHLTAMHAMVIDRSPGVCWFGLDPLKIAWPAKGIKSVERVSSIFCRAGASMMRTPPSDADRKREVFLGSRCYVSLPTRLAPQGLRWGWPSRQRRSQVLKDAGNHRFTSDRTRPQGVAGAVSCRPAPDASNSWR